MEDAPPDRHGSHVEVEQPLQLIQREHKMLPESPDHKILQLLGRRVGGSPSITVSVVKVRGRGTGKTIDGTVGNAGSGSVHWLVFSVADVLLLDMDAASRTSGLQVFLQRRLFFQRSLLSHLQTLLPADVDGI